MTKHLYPPVGKLPRRHQVRWSPPGGGVADVSDVKDRGSAPSNGGEKVNVSNPKVVTMGRDKWPLWPTSIGVRND